MYVSSATGGGGGGHSCGSRGRGKARFRRAANALKDRNRATSLEVFLEKELPKFIDRGDATFKEKFTVAIGTGIWDRIHFKVGHFAAEESARLIREEGRDVVAFELRFERGRADVRVGLSPGGEVVGFWVDRVEPEIEYEAPGYVDVEAFIDEPVRVAADEKFPLRGRITIPVGEGPFPGVVLISDAGPLDVNATTGPNQVFKDVAWGFASQKLAVLRVEKRSFAYPRAYPPAEWTPEVEFIDDAVAAVAALRKHPKVDPRAVFLLGHGMGGVITPTIARKDPQIAGVVLLATPARPMLNMIEDQLHYLVNFDQIISEKEQRELAAALEAIASVRAGDPKGSILNTPAMYWSRYEKLDPVRTCLATKQPLLIVRGERDFQVTEEDTVLWKSRLADRSDVEFRTYRRLNHLLMGGLGTGPSSPGEYSSPGKVSKEVVLETAQWILSKAPKPTTPVVAPESASTQPPAGPPSPDNTPTP